MFRVGVLKFIVGRSTHTWCVPILPEDEVDMGTNDYHVILVHNEVGSSDGNRVSVDADPSKDPSSSAASGGALSEESDDEPDGES